MPAVDLCIYCHREIDTAKEKFVVVTVAHQSIPRAIAPVECKQKEDRAIEGTGSSGR
jgi:hypothetical protein